MGAACHSTANEAESALEEVVVSASLMESDPLHTSITLVDEGRMAARNAQHLEDILSAAVNVSFASGASRGRFFQIRGIGERSQFVEPINASVAMLLDGIDLTGIGGAGLLFDLEQVEVLRGPQGTLFGANALAGLINLQPSRADSGAIQELSAGIENYKGRQLGLRLGGALTPTLSGRVSAQTFQSDGYIENTWLGREDTNGRDETQLRIHSVWEQDAHAVEALWQHLDIDNGYDAFSLDNTRQTLSDEPGRDALRLNAGSLAWRWRGEALQTSLQLSGADSDTQYRYDEDWSYIGIAPGWEYSSVDDYRRDRRMNSLEGRVQPADNSSLRWVAGFYLRDENEDLTRDYTYLPAPFASRLDTRTEAAFAQLDGELANSWAAFAGLRIERRESDYRDSEAVSEAFSDSYWSGKAGIRWTLNDEHRLFATLARGVRAGGVNAGLLSSLDALPEAAQPSLTPLGFFDEESLLSIEAGWQWQTTAYRSTVTLFTMDRRDQQARGSVVVPRDDGSTAFIDYTDNAAKGVNQGLEWQGWWQPIAELDIDAAVGLLDASFDEYTTAVGEDLSGRDQPQAPNWQYALSARYQFTTNIAAFVEATGSDSYFFSDRHSLRSPERHLLNANIEWRGDRVTIRLWGRNLTDRTTFVRGFGTFGNDPRKFYELEPYVQYGEPRVYGVTVSYDFMGDI
jgi:outer membrane receptor protein involved in Fe transport